MNREVYEELRRRDDIQHQHLALISEEIIKLRMRVSELENLLISTLENRPSNQVTDEDKEGGS